MSVLQILLLIAAIAAPVMLVLWLLQLRTRDAGIVDAGWALCLAAAAVFIALQSTGDSNRRLALGLLNGIWALRLGIYLLRDRVLAGHEDGRYQRMRAAMGKHANLGFFAFFQVQAGFVVLFAVPVAGAATNPSAFGVLDILGIAVGIFAIIGELIADRQLAKFRQRPASAGRTCREGLWRYSRHPNYFFEWLHWFAYALMAMTGPSMWLGLAGPVVMLVFLFKITGIPHTETQAASHRSDYADYQRSTSMFFPWLPKQESLPLPPSAN